MSTIRGSYDPIDVQIEPAEGSLWPATIPPMSAYEAERALRRLYRWGMGERFEGSIRIASGNRRAVRFDWSGGRRRATINPSQGWREFAHGLSHWLGYLGTGTMAHSKEHARFERSLVKEIVRRGWLDGKLVAQPKAEVVSLPKETVLAQRRREKLARIEARIDSWERKQRRAEKALAKLAQQRRYYERALGEAA